MFKLKISIILINFFILTSIYASEPKFEWEETVVGKEYDKLIEKVNDFASHSHSVRLEYEMHLQKLLNETEFNKLKQSERNKELQQSRKDLENLKKNFTKNLGIYITKSHELESKLKHCQDELARSKPIG